MTFIWTKHMQALNVDHIVWLEVTDAPLENRYLLAHTANEQFLMATGSLDDMKAELLHLFAMLNQGDA